MMAIVRFRPAAVVLLAVALILSAGCKKQRANLNQKKLADMVNTAQGHEAEKYRKDQFAAVQQQLQQVQQAYQGQAYDQAFEQSRTALAQAETLLEEVKRERAADLQNLVASDIKVAQDNGGESLDPQRFQKILELQQSGAEEFSKNDWDGAIEDFSGARREVDSLLATLKQEAATRLAEIRTRINEMEAEKAREFAIDQAIQVDEGLKQAEQLINDRQYRTAQTILSTTNQKIDEAIETAKEVRGQILLGQIELDLWLAIQKGARVFFPDRLKSAAALYETMLRDFENRRFDNVLQAGGLLEPQVRQLRYDTRQRSAQTKVQSLETDIQRLDEGGARQYLPGTVESLEALLEDARNQLNLKTEEGFEEAEQITQAASEEHARILADFNELANQAITDANRELETAAGIFGATDKIFDVRIPGRETTQLERQLEANKQAMKAELQTLLDSARVSLGLAQLRRDSQRYREAIETAEDVEETARLIQDETYRVAAHNSILEVAGALSYYSGQGGSQYASSQVQEVQSILADARKSLEAGQPKEAVDTAALAKAQLDVLRQSLSERGAQNLLEAEQAIRQAVETRALDYASGRMEEARSRLEQAIQARDLFDYKTVIENAASAEAIASAAQTYAQQRYAEVQLAEAKARLSLATQADAAIYAPRQFKEASDKIAAAQDLIAGAKYTDAAEMARQATEVANQAAYERVLLAEQQIETARHYESWQYSSATMAEAINAAKEARRLAELGNFELARCYADESIRLAKGATITSKGADVSLRLAGMTEDIHVGMKSGVNLFQGDEVKQILARMAELRATYTPDTYDAVDEELRTLEARLSEILINTPAVLERAVQEQTARRQMFLDSPVEIEVFASDQLDESEKLLRYAKIDFEKGLYSRSYQNLSNAIKLLDQVDYMVGSSHYNGKIGELFAEFVDTQDDFSHVLSLSETAMIQFAVNTVTDQPQVTAIAGEASPNEYRDRIEDLYKRAKAIEPPSYKRLTHQSVLDLFELALRSAQNFEKLVILNQFSKQDAREIIHDAYEQLRRARELQQQIELTFREPGTDSVIVKKRQVAGTALY